MKARVQNLRLCAEDRVLAVSDIHGNLPYLKGLLEKASFSEEDTLLLLGDMLERGEQSLDTLRFIMELSKRYKVHALCGNCDGWHRIFEDWYPASDERLRQYIITANGWRPGLLAQMCAELGLPVGDGTDMAGLKSELARAFAPEFEFLASLPTIIDAGDYVFVHGGVPSLERMASLDDGPCMKNDEFLRQGRVFERWVIVGHWPVVLYREDIVCANPIIDRAAKIASIDGGCVLKDDGQLNALVLPKSGGDFSYISYDSFPQRRVLDRQERGGRSYYIRYGDNRVRVLERGSEFSLCRHIRTGYTMEILTKYLRGEGDICRCNDCTDLILGLDPGDTVSVVETTGRGYFVKHKGVSGWYFGRLG